MAKDNSVKLHIF